MNEWICLLPTQCKYSTTSRSFSNGNAKILRIKYDPLHWWLLKVRKMGDDLSYRLDSPEMFFFFRNENVRVIVNETEPLVQFWKSISSPFENPRNT
jgi:hypothetical protein